MPRSNNGRELRAGLLKQVVVGCKCLITMDFLKKMATRIEARSLKLSANLVVGPARYGPKQNTHAKKCTRRVRKKAQTEDFRCLIADQRVVVPNGVRRKNNVADKEILTTHALCLDFPEEEEEDFDDCAYRATPGCLL